MLIMKDTMAFQPEDSCKSLKINNALIPEFSDFVKAEEW